MTGQIYISIKDIAPLVGYEAHNGEYKINTEDTTKMYVEAKNGTETTSFYLNSNQINKTPPNSTDDYEHVEIKIPVSMINNKWYIDSESFMQAFNSAFYYDKETNKFQIQTLPYLVSYYKENVKTYGYDEISDDFNNQKALIYGMLVASKSSTGKFGVVNVKTNEEIIGPRYNKIEFLEGPKEFIITNSSDKVGITYSTGETKISVKYDDIKVFNSNLGYYLVQSNEKYGVINSKEELVVHIEYDVIGINSEDFITDSAKSQYMLYDNLIPACVNGKWDIFDKTGAKITGEQYDTVGCAITKDMTERVVNNVVTVGDTGVVIVSKDGKYGGINAKKDLLLPVMFDYVYSLTSGGETKYYVVYNEKDYSATDYIDRMKEALGYNKEEEDIDKTNASIAENMSELQIQLFNVQFQSYEGEHSGSSVRSLINTVKLSNEVQDIKVKIEHNGKIYINDTATLTDIIDISSKYTVELQYNQNVEFIEKIIIK